MKRVSIEQAFIDAIEETDENLGRFPNLMNKWGKYIEREIGSRNGYKVKASLKTVTGCYIDLDPDCYRVLGVFPGNYADECNIQYRNIVSPIITEDTRAGEDVYDRDLTYLWVPANTTWVAEMFWAEVGDQLHMIQEYENQEMTVVYNYNETDDRGFWIVNESHIPAISLYIQYMYARKHRWNMFKGDKLLRQGHTVTLGELKHDYNMAVRNARAEDGQETPFESEQY